MHSIDLPTKQYLGQILKSFFLPAPCKSHTQVFSSILLLTDFLQHNVTQHTSTLTLQKI